MKNLVTPTVKMTEGLFLSEMETLELTSQADTILRQSYDDFTEDFGSEALDIEFLNDVELFME